MRGRAAKLAVSIVGAVVFAAGCAVFVLESQTLGGFLLAGGLALSVSGLMGDDSGDEIEAWAARHRRSLLVLGAVLVAAGWAVFMLVHQDAGLLLVVLAGLVLGAVLVSVQHDQRGGPTDGPWYGDTTPGGFVDGGL
jgi:hypothetical protein